MKVGQVVRSVAGHDKNRFYLVVELRGEEKALIADGKRRKLEKPKLKNTKHLGATTTILNVEEMRTNKSLKAALRIFNGAENQ
jgi:ribosomal protein L14E/L6E/L27E